MSADAGSTLLLIQRFGVAMHSESAPRKTWKYERVPRAEMETARSSGFHGGLLLALSFCLAVWAAVGAAAWIYLVG